MVGIGFDEIVAGFQAANVLPGDTVLIHSALRPFGMVDGGAATVAKALKEAVGSEGTVIAPAFCFSHEIVENPIIDPANDPSEMGAISEAIRKLPGAIRSSAYRHSFSAAGKNAEIVTNVDPSLAVYNMRSSFGKMVALNTKIILLGVTFINCTSHHFAEYLIQVPYRQILERQVRLKTPDGALTQMTMIDYQPKPDASGETYVQNFNRSGRMLEQEGSVTISNIGNAMIRTFRMLDLIDLLLRKYPFDNSIFTFAPGTTIRNVLPDGIEVAGDHTDGAGRPDHAVWACVDPEKIHKSNRP
jgi:aminoglycoside 3-N-acetyltransferase